MNSGETVTEAADAGNIEALRLCVRSYYVHCLETAFDAVTQAQALVEGDPVESNHELPKIRAMLLGALRAS